MNQNVCECVHMMACDSLSSQKRAAENNVSDIQGKEGHYLNLIPLNNILDASTATDCLSTRRKEEYSLPAWDHLEKAHRTPSRKRMASWRKVTGSVGERLLDQTKRKNTATATTRKSPGQICVSPAGKTAKQHKTGPEPHQTKTTKIHGDCLQTR